MWRFWWADRARQPGKHWNTFHQTIQSQTHNSHTLSLHLLVVLLNLALKCVQGRGVSICHCTCLTYQLLMKIAISPALESQGSKDKLWFSEGLQHKVVDALSAEGKQMIRTYITEEQGLRACLRETETLCPDSTTLTSPSLSIKPSAGLLNTLVNNELLTSRLQKLAFVFKLAITLPSLLVVSLSAFPRSISAVICRIASSAFLPEV